MALTWSATAPRPHPGFASTSTTGARRLRRKYEDSTQSNLGWPYAIGCEDCGEQLGVWEEALRIRLANGVRET